MSRKCYTPEQIIGKLREAEVALAQGETAGRFGPPKSGKRLIDLDETLVGKLEVHIKKMRKESMAEGRLPSPYLFPGITQRMIQRAMQRACKAARLRVRNPHDLRHTYATLLLMAHYSPAYVQKQLGHSSISRGQRQRQYPWSVSWRQ